MKRISIVILALLLILPGVVLFARGGSEEVIDDIELAGEGVTVESVYDTDYSAWESGRKGGRIVFATVTDPKSFNGMVAAETSSTDITDLTESSAISRDQLTLEYVPELATGWTISSDETQITVNLQRDLKFSDGTPITAKDFVFTINQLVLREDVGSNSRSGYFIAPEAGATEEPVKVVLVNDYTYRLELPTVYADMVGLAGITPYPRHIFGPLIGWTESVGYEYNWSFGEDEEGNSIVVEEKPAGVDYAAVQSFWGVDMDVTKLVGSGPFVLSEYIASERIVLKANPYFHATDEQGVQLPYLDEIVYVVVPDQDTSLQKFRAGEIDVFGMRGEDYSVLVGEQDQKSFKIFNIGPSGGSEFVTMNQNPIRGEDDAGLAEPAVNWFSNKSFRHAVAHMIDRKSIVDNVAQGLAFPNFTFIPRVSPYYWNGAEDFGFKYDPAKARELLDSIDYIDRDGDGWREDPDGNTIQFKYQTNVESTNRVKIGEIVSEDLRSIGLNVEFVAMAFNELVGQLLGSYDWEMIGIGLTASVEPSGGSNVYPSSGNLHMIEPEQTSPIRDWEKKVDELWVYANNTTNQAQRVDGYQQLQQIWIDEAPWIFTYSPLGLTAVNNYIGNWKTHNFNPYAFKNAAERVFIR